MRKSRRLGNTWNNQKCKESHFQKVAKPTKERVATFSVT